MLDITLIEVTPFIQNCRILNESGLSDAVVIDPGGDVELILSKLKEMGLTCKEIWLTHSHLDHCGGVKGLIDATGARLYGHQNEAFMRERVEAFAALYGLQFGMENCPEPDTYLQGGEVLSLGSSEFEVLFTPGHSPGHFCFYHKDSGQLIAGDTLFSGSIGRFDLPGADFKTFMASIRDTILTLPDDTKVLAGHGPDTEVGVEKRSNPFLREYGLVT